MSEWTEKDLESAWQEVDQRLVRLQAEMQNASEAPPYDMDLKPPATAAELSELTAALHVKLPWELAYSLRRWNGRWIAPDHMIELAPVSDYVQTARSSPWRPDNAALTFEQVKGPISPVMFSKKRVCFGMHHTVGGALYLDFEDPPAGGRLGQIIRVGEEPVAEFVAPSFVEFLRLVAAAPPYLEDQDLDPLVR